MNFWKNYNVGICENIVPLDVVTYNNNISPCIHMTYGKRYDVWCKLQLASVEYLYCVNDIGLSVYIISTDFI